MTLPGQDRITERVVLRVLVAGFGLVVAFLGLAGFVGVRGTRAIKDDAAQIGREQLAMARLLNDIQAGQNTMAAILHQLVPGQDSINRTLLLKDLESADLALSSIAMNASGTPEATRWHQFEKAVRVFSKGVREAVERGGELRAAELVLLFDKHDDVVRIEQQLLESSERRMEATERRIENESRDLASNARILLGACLVLALLCAVLTLVFARSSIRKIEAQASELSRVSWHMLQDQESMARRFSHELHDELGQSLAAIKANLTAGSSADWESRRSDCIGLVGEAITNVRELSQLLHPVILDDFGLDAGLRWLSEGFAQRTGIRTDYVSTFHERVDPETETHLFRIAQEGLTNIARHSGATSTVLELHRIGDAVTLSIEDNGRGIREGQALKQPSLGLTGMRARTQEIQGELRMSSPSAGGLRIEVKVPLRIQKEINAD